MSSWGASAVEPLKPLQLKDPAGESMGIRGHHETDRGRTLSATWWTGRAPDSSTHPRIRFLHQGPSPLGSLNWKIPEVETIWYAPWAASFCRFFQCLRVV